MAARTLLQVQDPNNVSSILFPQSSAVAAKAAAAADQVTTSTSSTTTRPYVSSSLKLTTTGVQHGRGLVATNDISAGALLFVTPAVLACNVAKVKQQFWQEKTTCIVAKHDSNDDIMNNDTLLLERLAEQDLVHAMKQAIENKDAAIVNSFMALMGRSSSSSKSRNSDTCDMMNDGLNLSVNRLLGNDNNSLEAADDDNDDDDVIASTDEDLLQIIRRNAFGPDFVTYKVIAKRWRQDLQQQQQQNEHDSHNSACSNKSKFVLPHRILGLYPFAAMINHSCHPNAVRVYCQGEVMMVHANQDIAAGQEIVWSYLPPTQSFPVRQAVLQQQHGFVCMCTRCKIEQPFFELSANNNKLNELVQLQQQHERQPPHSSGTRAETPNDKLYAAAIESLENDILMQPDLTNELRRYVRVGFMDIYIHYLNTTASTKTSIGQSYLQQQRPQQQHDDNESLLQLCTQLHFSFCACGNASTEHLSILHLCYELMGQLHTKTNDKSKTLPKLRFWTEQVKRACMIRYGALGHQIEAVRTVMQHTRLVLRQQNGLDQAQYNFI